MVTEMAHFKSGIITTQPLVKKMQFIPLVSEKMYKIKRSTQPQAATHTRKHRAFQYTAKTTGLLPRYIHTTVYTDVNKTSTGINKTRKRD